MRTEHPIHPCREGLPSCTEPTKPSPGAMQPDPRGLLIAQILLRNIPPGSACPWSGIQNFFLVDIEFAVADGRRPVGGWETTYIIQCDGRKGTNRIQHGYAIILDGYTGQTTYVRKVNSKEKEIIPPHVTKYKQELNKGDWVVGVGPGKKLQFGAVVKWTKTSVQVTAQPELRSKAKTKTISHPYESFKLPQEVDYDQIVTMMTLMGWRP